MGLDWCYGVVIFMLFLVCEVFVGVLGILFGMESVDEDVVGLVECV